MNVPLVLIGFNRPALFERLVSLTDAWEGDRVYFISDGPRAHRPRETELVERTRMAIDPLRQRADVVEVFSDTNLGCRLRIQTGLNEVFSREDRAIILEDDCHPSPDFFSHTSSLLERYRDDVRVGTIAGTNLGIPVSTSSGYAFTSRPLVWGWATWRRVWSLYDPMIRAWEDNDVKTEVKRQCLSASEFAHWSSAFDAVVDGFDTWDYQLVFCSFLNKHLHAVPSKNLITNVGFGPDATHTRSSRSSLANLRTEGLEFDPTVAIDVAADSSFDETLIKRHYLSSRRRKIRSALGELRYRLLVGNHA
jgi:hypothetical protein